MNPIIQFRAAIGNRSIPFGGQMRRMPAKHANKACLAIIAAAFVVGTTPAFSEILTFDPLPPGAVSQVGGGRSIPDGYAGLTWLNLSIGNSLSPSWTGINFGYKVAAVSPSHFAFSDNPNGSSTPGTPIPSGPPIDPWGLISAATPYGFSLVGGYFTAAWTDGLTVTANATFKDLTTEIKSFTVNSTGPTYLAFNWDNLASVRFVATGGTAIAGTSGGREFAFDDLNISAVPEPGTTAMALAGLGALAVVTRRRKKGIASLPI